MALDKLRDPDMTQANTNTHTHTVFLFTASDGHPTASTKAFQRRRQKLQQIIQVLPSRHQKDQNMRNKLTLYILNNKYIKTIKPPQGSEMNVSSGNDR